TPEGHERAVCRFCSAADGIGPRDEARVAFLRSIDVDAVPLRRVEAVLAEARRATAAARPSVIGDEDVAERPLTLAAPHQSVDVVRPQVILDHAEPELPRVGIARAREGGLRPAQHDLARLLETGNVGGDHVLEPADDLHATLAGGREHVSNYVV